MAVRQRKLVRKFRGAIRQRITNCVHYLEVLFHHQGKHPTDRLFANDVELANAVLVQAKLIQRLAQQALV